MAGDLAKTAAALREFALGLPGAWEDFPWEDDRIAKVGRRCSPSLGAPGRGTTTASRSCCRSPASRRCHWGAARPTGYGLGRANWVTIEVAAEDCPPLEVGLDWIEESYRTIAPKTLVRGL